MDPKEFQQAKASLLRMNLGQLIQMSKAAGDLSEGLYNRQNSQFQADKFKEIYEKIVATEEEFKTNKTIVSEEKVTSLRKILDDIMKGTIDSDEVLSERLTKLT